MCLLACTSALRSPSGCPPAGRRRAESLRCAASGRRRPVRRQYVAVGATSRPYTGRRMKKLGLILAGFGFLGLGVSARPQTPQTLPPNAENALVKQYCVTCHNDRTKPGDLSLASFEVSEAA